MARSQSLYLFTNSSDQSEFNGLGFVSVISLVLQNGARAGMGESLILLEAPQVLLSVNGARAGTRTRVQALATLGDNHYTTLASVTIGLDRGINRYRLETKYQSGVSESA
jgi:hypothetical protein